MCDSHRSKESPKFTPLKGAFLAANPAGFLIYNKINHGKVWPFGKNKKDKDDSNTEGSTSSSSSSKKHSKKDDKKDKLELERELYEFDDRDADARSTSSEVAPPAYSRK